MLAVTIDRQRISEHRSANDRIHIVQCRISSVNISPLSRGTVVMFKKSIFELNAGDLLEKSNYCLNITNSRYPFRTAGKWKRPTIVCHQYAQTDLSFVNYFLCAEATIETTNRRLCKLLNNRYFWVANSFPPSLRGRSRLPFLRSMCPSDIVYWNAQQLQTNYIRIILKSNSIHRCCNDNITHRT